MSHYRLLAGDGTVVEAFEAADDQRACARGREVARKWADRDHVTAVRGDFRVERCDGEIWRLIFAWVPWTYLGGTD